MILALSSKSRLPLSRKGRERGEGDGYRGWGIREENSRAKAGARAISRRFSGARVSPRPGRATRCACARSIRCRSWRLIGRPLPDKSRSRSCRSERGRAAIRGLSARLFPRPPLQRRQSAYYHRLCLLFFPSLPRIYTIVSRTYIYRTRIYILYIHVIYVEGKGLKRSLFELANGGVSTLLYARLWGERVKMVKIVSTSVSFFFFLVNVEK